MKLIIIMLELVLLPLIFSRFLVWVRLARPLERVKGTIINWSFFILTYTIVGLNREIFSLAKEDAVILHPGPVNRGVELSDDLADSAQSRILNQVESGVAVRMALLYLLAGGHDGSH